MEISAEELQHLIDAAVEKAINKVAPKKQFEDTDIQSIINAFSFSDMTNEELLYYSTPYYDEIQDQKNKKQSKEEV